jgi:hypothetical protein
MESGLDMNKYIEIDSRGSMKDMMNRGRATSKSKG